MKWIGPLLGALVVPIGILNGFGGVVGGIWLIFSGHWLVPILCTFVGAFAVMGIGLALMPGVLLAGPGFALADRSPILALPFVAASNAWTYAVMGAWGIISFYLVPSHVFDEHMVPALLVAYATAISPWAYMAGKEAQSDPNSMAFLPTLFASVGFLAVSWGVWHDGVQVNLETMLQYFAPVMAGCLLVETALAFAMAQEKRRYSW